MTAMDPSTQGIEAQKLISISLGKMAASRVGKCGSSLHKSLLVASVLQRARHVYLEENYHNYHYRCPTMAPMPIYAPHVPPPPPCEPPTENDENRCATPMQQEMLPQMPQEPLQEECCDVPQRMPLADASNQQQQQQRAVALKRRRCVSDKETQEAVSSILPKRFRSCSDENVNPNCAAGYEEQHLSCAQQDCAAVTFEASSFPGVCNASSLPAVYTSAENSISSCCSNVLVPIPVSENVLASSSLCATGDCSYENALPEGARETTATTAMMSPMSPSVPNPIYCTLEPISDDEEEEEEDDDDDDVNSMEVEHITSLVSIFSFGAPRQDMCATQAAREEHAQFTPVALAV